MRNLTGVFLATAISAGALVGIVACQTQAAVDDESEETFPLGTKDLLPPEIFDRTLVVSVGEPEKTAIEQPIAFPHKTHVQTLGMDCQYCHSGARKGAHAGVPSTQLCMNCHAKVSTDGRPELDKLVNTYWKDGTGEPIEWNKVHDVPDFVYFSHKPHVRGGVQCSECHGQVQEMDTAQRVSSLKMGWCLDCHAQHDSIDVNYGEKAELRRAELKDCYTCHK